MKLSPQTVQFIDLLSLWSQNFTEKTATVCKKRKVVIIRLQKGGEVGLLVCTLLKGRRRKGGVSAKY